MKLDNLKAPAPNQKTRKRVGRGEGSGLGQQSGRGHKGQKAGSGYSKKIGFEGGQMPLQRRIPKFGFKNRFRVEYRPINLARIDAYIDEGKLTDTITVANLIDAGLAHKNDRVKILGQGEISRAITIEAHGFSKSAEEKISKAEGTATVLK